MNDTIYALSTSAGRAGVAVLRVSGPQALAGLKKMTSEKQKIIPRHALFCSFSNPESGAIMDKGVALYFSGPASFTGEDVVEYQIHGSPAVIKSFMAALSTLDQHRVAEPGEFTRRAFENGKMDLTEAEAVADLIHAETQLQQEQALAQMGGALSRLYNSWTETLKNCLAYLEADLEFPEEDLPEGVLPDLLPKLKDVAEGITAHLEDGRRGEILRDGIRVAVVGAPNAGKSSLVNAMAMRDVAIVSDMAGTTRDVIEAQLDLNGYPVILSDTAGLRPDQIGEDGQHSIEQEGIRRALQIAAQADLKILLFDASALPALDEHTVSLVDDRALVVFNKSELFTGDRPLIGGREALAISAKTGAGLQELIAAIIAKINALQSGGRGPALTRQRHRTALQESLAAIRRGLKQPAPELVAEDIRLAVRAIGKITGRVDVEDLLDVIFRDFCIGK